MKELLLDADRCFLCKNPRCRANCPIDTPIPEVISLFKEGKCFDMILSLDPTLPIILTSNNSKTYSINQNDYATNMLKKYLNYPY